MKAAKYLKQKKKVEIYVIGVGEKIKHKSLKKLASRPENTHTFSIENYDKLNKIIDTIVVKGKI